MLTSSKFDDLYQAHYKRVFGLCRRLLNSASQAEDASQEAFMRAYKIRDKYDPAQAFWPWIARIANNYCIDLLRKRQKTQLIFGNEEEEIELLASTDTQAISGLIAKEDADVLSQAIGDLPEKYRIPFLMAYQNEATYDDIAEVLSINRNHVGVLLLRAKQQLRESLNGSLEEQTS